MKKIISLALIFCFLDVFATETPQNCTHWLSVFKPFCHRLHQVWDEGKTDFYMSGYAWHNRYTYTEKKIKSYNEQAWGWGMGKGLFDEKGNWHGMSVVAFLDSHSDLQGTANYSYLKILNLGSNLKAGLGYTLLFSSRVDMIHYFPVPIILPLASVFFNKISVGAVYIPGKINTGNVLYLFGRYTF